MNTAWHGGLTRFAAAVGVGSLLTAGLSVTHAAPVLDVEGSTLTTYKPASKTRVQDLRPLPQQRGVGIDGGLIAPAPQGWAIAADTISGGVQGGRRLGNIDLLTLAYAPTEIDLALPTLGPPVVIGRTYNNRQSFGGSRYDSDGYQGRNWAQIAQPAIVFYDADSTPATLGADDCVYLVYGADRYIEFKRTGADHTEFKAKNGAAGVMQFVAGGSAADEYHYHDAAGNEVVFFGENSGTTSGGKNASWQWWKTIDAAGKVAYVGHATNSATAISSGYETTGQIKNITDASGRLYTFTYSSGRLTSVVATVSSVPVGTVDYTYHDGTTASGSSGDLQTAKVTLPMAAGSYVTESYYRYYKGSYGTGNRGTNHWLKGAVGREGVRKADLAGTSPAATIDGLYKSMSDTDLKPYSEAWVEYLQTSGKEGMIDVAVLGGQCGCSGGVNGTFNFTSDVGSGPTLTDTTYQQAWAFRTVIDQPDTAWVTQYFDEVGQPLARVTTNADPTASPSRTWVSDIVRDTSGIVTAMRSPASINTYTHSSGAITANSSSGLVTKFTLETSGDLAGLRLSTALAEGDSPAGTTVGSVTLLERTRRVGSNGFITRPFVDSSSTYPGGSAITTGIAYAFWDSSNSPGDLVPKTVEVTAPAVASGNNGSGTATSTFTYHRLDGSVAFTKSADGILSYSGRSEYGQTSRTIADANTATTGDFLNANGFNDAPSVWSLSSTSGALHIKSDMTFDEQGRMLSVTRPSVNGAGTRVSGQGYTPNSLDGTYAVQSYPLFAGGNYHGPVQTTIYNQANQPEVSGTIAVTSPGTTLPSASYDSSSWSAVTTHQYDEAGAKRLSSRSYKALPGSLPGSSTDYDQTSYGYDTMGRTIRVADATGTIRKTTFDDIGRPTESWIGTDDSGTGPDNMTKTETREYDGGPSASGGNSFLTTVTQDADGNWSTTTDQRVSTMVYDFRGRVLVRNNPVSPHQRMKYDNSGRTVAVGGYSATATSGSDPSSTATARLSLSETSYDERGQVFRTVRHEVTQSTGALGSSITDNTWYDAVGRAIATAGSRITKTQYDRLGRAIGSFLIAKTNDSSYADRQSVTGDIVVQESWTGLHVGTGLPLVRHTVDRNHDDGLSGGTTGALNTSGATSLSSIAVGSITGRVQITATWYDDLDRVLDTVALGTNNGSTYTRSGASAPSRSDTALRTTYTYDNFGRVSDITDPGDADATGGRIQRTEYDAAGRRLRVIDNYTNGTPGGGTKNDEDRVVEYTYGAGGLVTAVTRKMTSSGDDQTTTYTYGVAKTGGTLNSAIASGQLLASILLPEQTSGQSSADRTILYAYNALGQTTSTKDAAGNIIDTAYDVGGRPITRTASTVASGFDNRVLTIETSYTSRGQVDTVTQKGASAVVRDQLDFRYDGWGNTDRMRQDPDSTIGASSGRDEFETTYTYTLTNGAGDPTVSWAFVKLTEVAQPGSVPIEYTGTGAVWDLLGSHGGVKLDSLTVATYKHMGAGVAAAVEYGEPNIAARMYDPASGSSTYGSYIDRFNRVTRHTWVKELSGSIKPAFVDIDYERTRFGGAGVREDDVLRLGVPSNSPVAEKRIFDGVGSFDGLRRLINSAEGERSGGSIATPAREEVLSRDLLGRITSHKVDLNGNGTFVEGTATALNLGEMDDLRTHNKRNELRRRQYLDSAHTTTRTDITLSYDKNGSLTDDGEKYTYTYNPWGQLVEVKDRLTPYNLRTKITYNGLGMKISEQDDSNRSADDGIVDGVVNSYDPVFYLATDLMGRRVATYRNTDAWPKQIFIYHAPGVGGPNVSGGPILRDRNHEQIDPTTWATTAGDESRRDRIYYAANDRGQIAAIVNDTGQLIEQYRHSPTCVPWLIIAGDLNADTLVQSSSGQPDKLIVDELKGTYQVRADLDLDGDVDSADETTMSANAGTTGGRASTESVRRRDGLYDTDVFVGARSVWIVAKTCLTEPPSAPARVPTPPFDPGWTIPLPYSSPPSCNDNIAYCMRYHPLVRLYINQLQQCDPSFPTDTQVPSARLKCTECPKDSNGNVRGGAYSCRSKGLEICANAVPSDSTSNDFCHALAHELDHWLRDCQTGYRCAAIPLEANPHRNCSNFLCEELKAYSNAGNCCSGSYARRRDPSLTYDACLRKSACNSAREACKQYTDEACRAIAGGLVKFGNCGDKCASPCPLEAGCKP